MVLILLMLPLVQQWKHPFAEPAIGGVVVDAPKPEFSSENILNGSFQTSTTEYLKDVVGFRSLFVGINNDMQYRLFHHIPSEGVVKGRDGFLFETGYVDSYMGKDFLGSSAIRKKLDKVLFLQDTLKSMGIDLILVFAPNKARCYSDHLPGYPEIHPGRSNYDEYIKQSKQLGIPFIDINGWFMEAKDTSRYPLITRLGTHWDSYGMVLAMDSIASYLEKSQGIDLPEILIDTLIMRDSTHPLEYDLARLLNLLLPLSQSPAPVPVYHFSTTGKTKPRVLAIADSYYSFVYTGPLASGLFSEPHYWYYFKGLFSPGKDKLPTEKVDLMDEIRNQDVIIIMATESNLFNFGWGFIEKAFSSFKGIAYQNALNEKRVREFEQLIRANPKWLEQVKLKAEQRNVSLDSMIRLDALYMTEREQIINQ
ncbi:MAG: hypothetical protein JXA23_12170 [Bacteroidales bacterium]|nr:hypothetical protein [Bacteroidales bacterium]